MAFRIHVHDDGAALAGALALLLAGEARRAVAERGTCSIALSGGSTPEALYRILGRDDAFPWNRTRFFLVDERLVPPDHPDWNAGMIRRAFDREDMDFFPMDTENPADGPEAARYYELVLQDAFGGDPVFDICLLGMGADGHTASLFPGTGAAEVTDRRVLWVVPPAAPHGRVSLSLPVLRASRALWVLCTGPVKAPALGKVLAGPDPELPASLLAAAPAGTDLHIDRALARAAGLEG